MLSDMNQNGQLVVGAKQTLKAISEGDVAEVYIAKDADYYVVRAIEEAALENKINITYIDSMKKLGKDCNIAVGAAVAAIRIQV